MPKNKKQDLPQMLVLKRKFIQRFPNGQQVALYHSEYLNQFITVPLDNSQFSATIESVIEELNIISDTNMIGTIVFEDESTLNIDKECADTVLEYLNKNDSEYPNVCYSDSSFLTLLEQAILEHSDITESEDITTEILPNETN
jgi:hypothetical protein